MSTANKKPKKKGVAKVPVIMQMEAMEAFRWFWLITENGSLFPK